MPEAVECRVPDRRPETVFRYFTDPARMVQWKGIGATLEARPGGVYRVDINGRDVIRGRYVEVDPPRRVVFTFGWEANGHQCLLGRAR
jgi:uncharacterized protein YndB with AHSA1/START domain